MAASSLKEVRRRNQSLWLDNIHRGAKHQISDHISTRKTSLGVSGKELLSKLFLDCDPLRLQVPTGKLWGKSPDTRQKVPAREGLSHISLLNNQDASSRKRERKSCGESVDVGHSASYVIGRIHSLS
jgi:hypothetical protein